MSTFEDRVDAGDQLATRFARLRGRNDLLVLALPRGGVPVAARLAHALDVPLDVMTVRKIGAPQQPELALGAVASGGIIVANPELSDVRGCTERLKDYAAPALRELRRRERCFRGDRPALALDGRVVILVDDGAATGASMIAAIRATRALGATHIVVALPVASREAIRRIEAEADQVVCLAAPPLFQAVGDWYRDFTQTTDAEVCSLLAKAQLQHAAQ